MKPIWAILRNVNEFVLGRERTKQIHDIKNEYNAKAGSSLLLTNKMQMRIENTITYKIGLATGGKNRGL